MAITGDFPFVGSDTTNESQSIPGKVDFLRVWPREDALVGWICPCCDYGVRPNLERCPCGGGE